MTLLQLQRDLDPSLKARQPERTVHPISWGRRLFNALRSAFARSIRNRAIHHKLRVMDHRSLKDIGLDSLQIATTIEEKIEAEQRLKHGPASHLPKR